MVSRFLISKDFSCFGLCKVLSGLLQENKLLETVSVWDNLKWEGGGGVDGSSSSSG